MKFTKQTKQVVILYASTLSGVLLGVVASIINTRFLSPADYGDVRYVQNIINFIASLLLFGYFLSGSRLLAISSGEAESRRIRGCMIVILGGALVVLIAGILICTGLQFAQGKDHIAHLFLLSVPVCAYPLFLNYVNTTAMGDNHIKRLAAAQFKLYSDRILAIQPIGRHLLPHDSIAMGTGVVNSVPHNLIDPPPVQATIPHIPHFEQGE